MRAATAGVAHRRLARRLCAKPVAPKPDPAPVQSGQIIPLNTVRLKTGERLAENWRNIPHVFQAIEVDFTAIDRLRRKHKDSFQQAHGFSLTYLPFIARATCLALSSLSACQRSL